MSEPGPKQTSNHGARAEQSRSTNAANRRIYSKRHREKVKTELITLRNERQMLTEEIGALKAANVCLSKAIESIESKCEALLERAITAEKMNVELQERIHEQQKRLKRISAADEEGNLVQLQCEDKGMTTSTGSPTSRIEYIEDSRVPFMTEEELRLLEL